VWRHTFSKNCFPVPEEPSEQSDKGTTISSNKKSVNNQKKKKKIHGLTAEVNVTIIAVLY